VVKAKRSIRLEARLRNNILWCAIFERWPSVQAFCEEYDFSPQEVGRFLNLKKSPLRGDGKHRKACQEISGIFQMLPEDLFPPEIYSLPRVEAVLEVSFSELTAGERKSVAALLVSGEKDPESALIEKDAREALLHTVQRLPPREALAVSSCFGLEGREEATLTEIGRDLRVGKERARQVLSKGLGRLRKRARMRGPTAEDLRVARKVLL
jgi:hypothetical protein